VRSVAEGRNLEIQLSARTTLGNMQGFFHLAPLTRRDAFAWIGIGFFFLIYIAAVTVKKVRSQGVTKVELVAGCRRLPFPGTANLQIGAFSGDPA
jgi:hypothetical protein